MEEEIAADTAKYIQIHNLGEFIVRRSKSKLKKFREKTHILIGFELTIANINWVIENLRTAIDRVEGKDNLTNEFFDAENIKPMLEHADVTFENVDPDTFQKNKLMLL